MLKALDPCGAVWGLEAGGRSRRTYRRAGSARNVAVERAVCLVDTHKECLTGKMAMVGGDSTWDSKLGPGMI